MKHYHKNPRQITKQQLQDLSVDLKELGDLSGITHDLETDEILTGNQRCEALPGIMSGLLQPEITQSFDEPLEDGTALLGYFIIDGRMYFYRAVKGWDDKKREMANIVANKRGGSWDFDVLANEFEVPDLLAWGFDDKELVGFGMDKSKDAPPQTDRAEELRIKWDVGLGDLWQIGEHRLICGRSNDFGIVERLSIEEDAIVVTDPPYCSGGSQEAQKKSGTWGEIDSDNLSTRGYQTLMRSVIRNVVARAYYIFTDWRMWITLFDLVEQEGQPIRSMIVWAKPTPAMGGIWRTQHELVMFASQQNQAKRKGAGSIGNVIVEGRTGNKLHYTEKPVEVIEKIIVNDSTCKGRSDSVVADPFLGSGTTMVACENLSRKCRGIEISPGYVAVALQRMQDAFPELTIERIGLQ